QHDDERGGGQQQRPGAPVPGGRDQHGEAGDPEHDRGPPGERAAEPSAERGTQAVPQRFGHGTVPDEQWEKASMAGGERKQGFAPRFRSGHTRTANRSSSLAASSGVILAILKPVKP